MVVVVESGATTCVDAGGGRAVVFRIVVASTCVLTQALRGGVVMVGILSCTRREAHVVTYVSSRGFDDTLFVVVVETHGKHMR